MLAQEYYKSWRHDRVAQVFTGGFAIDLSSTERKSGIYSNIPEPILESMEHKMLWDNPTEANKSKIVVLNKESKECYIIDLHVYLIQK